MFIHDCLRSCMRKARIQGPDQDVLSNFAEILEGLIRCLMFCFDLNVWLGESWLHPLASVRRARKHFHLPKYDWCFPLEQKLFFARVLAKKRLLAIEHGQRYVVIRSYR